MVSEQIMCRSRKLIDVFVDLTRFFAKITIATAIEKKYTTISKPGPARLVGDN
jgi:hypothetical protein